MGFLYFMVSKNYRDNIPAKIKAIWDKAIQQENFQYAASLLTQAGNIDDAIDFCTQRNMIPEAIDIAVQNQKYDKALILSEQIHDESRLADILLLKGEKEKAAALLAKLQHNEQAAKLYFSIKQYEKAAVLYAQIKQYMNAIMCYQKSGNTEKQIEMQLAAFENDLEIANGDIQAVSVSRMMAIYAAKTLLEDPNTASRAIQILKKAEALESTADELLSAQRYELAALCYENAHNWQQAIEAYKLAQKPDQAICLCKNLQDDELEIQVLQYFKLYFKLGFKYANLKRYNEAIACLKKIDSNSPEYPSALELQGDIYCKLKQYQDAVLCYESLFWLDLSKEKICRIAYKAGYSYEAMEDYQNSLKNYQKVYDIDPNFHEISQTLDQVASRLRVKTNSTRDKLSQSNTKENAKTAGRVLRTASRTGERKRTPSIYIGETEVPAVALERYKIIEEVAHGGMGIVYKATDTLLMRTVALKVLSQKLKDNQVALEYFMREARASAALTHVNIVTVYDIGYFDDNVYMAMEFIEGQTLKSLIQKTGTFGTKLLVQIMTHACRGLQYAHENGIIHRDVKSSNMMLAKRSKTLKILDLGLAKVLDEQEHGSTQAIGTPYYMSPEQVLGNEIDARSDIYSLGVTLFEMATGVLPFVKGDLPYKHVHEPPPLPSSFNPNIHPKIEDMILKMMQKSPDDRYSSCNEIIADLKTIDLRNESGD